MASEFEHTPRFGIEELKVDDIDAATEMRKQSWIDTYVNVDLNITEEWINEYFADKLSAENLQKRRKRFLDAKAAGTFNAWVARDNSGKIIGSTTPFVMENGTQRVGSIYIDKEWHGKGLGAQLMQKVVDWFDPDKPIALEVISYNERAKAFYKKWGFEEEPGSETLYADRIPEITMIRKPNNQIEGEV